VCAAAAKVTRESVLQPEAVRTGGERATQDGVQRATDGRLEEQRSPCSTGYDSYLVDPASSRVLVSTTKPCMSKYKHLYCETANGSLYQL
jgi:hypothetical protein